jgi:ferrochelatase
VAHYDALLVLSFGGPNGPDEVIPFLENVLRGRNVPRERMLEVADHYQHFGGVSPINAQNLALIAALDAELKQHGIALPVYFGNRNWHPLLPDTLREMSQDGVRRALCFITSVFSSYSGCRQYLENIAAAQAEVGPAAPQVDKLRSFFNHPGFIAAMADRVTEALAALAADSEGVRSLWRNESVHLAGSDSARDSRPLGMTDAPILFTAHSIPVAMAATCEYQRQLGESCRLVAEAVAQGIWRLVYQSRSGPPGQPWLEPDVGDALRELAAQGGKNVVVAPIGFISDHMEVLFDLDFEARQIAEQAGLKMARASTVGVHPRFVTMIRELIQERLSGSADRAAIGCLPASHEVCPPDCCKYEPRRPGPAS